MCDLCGNSGYRMVNVGTHTIPDWEEHPCRCTPAPTDDDYDDFGYPGETPYPDFDVPVVDFGPGTLPARLLA